MKILIADLDTEFLDIASSYLRRFGHDVELAVDNRECIARLCECDPQLLILDRDIIDCDGFFSRIGALKSIVGLIVILFSDEEPLALRLGQPFTEPIYWIRKPFGLACLVERVASWEAQIPHSFGKAKM
jgi:DNA-binding response OmpR family regulator